MTNREITKSSRFRHQGSAFLCYTEYTCTKCGKTYTSDHREALGHAFGEWTVKTEATCEKAGTQESVCARCGRKETQTIARPAHDFGPWSTTREAACDTDGEQVRTCKACGAKENKAIAALGHRWDNGVVSGADGCSGGIKTYTCTVCGKTKTETLAANHDFGEWEYVEHPWSKTDLFGKTKNYMGHDKQRTCKKCGFVEKKVFEEHRCDVSCYDVYGDPIPGLYQQTLGTCVTHGEIVGTCSVCGYVTHTDLGLEPVNHVHTKTEKRHVCDYDYWHDGIDAVITTCQDCGDVSVSLTWDMRGNDINNYEFILFAFPNNTAASGCDDYNQWLVAHPNQQLVIRDIKVNGGKMTGYTACWTNADGTHHKEYIDLTLGWEGFIRKYARPESVDYYLGIGKGKIIIMIYGDRVYVSYVSW